MSKPKAICPLCGREVLKRTADRNEGLCAICHRKAISPPIKTISTPAHAVCRAAIDGLIDRGSRDAVIDALFDRADEKVAFRPIEMTEGDIIIYTVCTFIGEVKNGGLIQYFTNQSGDWAHHCGPSLRKIGAEKYAAIVEDCIRQFTDAKSPQDPKWESDLNTYWAHHPDPFEEKEELIRGFDDVQLNDLLYDYVIQNRDLFISGTVGL